MDTEDFMDDSPTIYAVIAWMFMALAILSGVGLLLMGAAIGLGMVGL